MIHPPPPPLMIFVQCHFMKQETNVFFGIDEISMEAQWIQTNNGQQN